MLSLEKLKTINLVDLINPKIIRFIWSAILDDKVCELCRSLDGKVMDVNSPEYTIYKSPIHPRCRCTQIPVTSDAEVIPEPNFEKPSNEWIIKFAPFWFLIPFKGKKKEPIEILPYAPEAPELIFNPEDVLSIEEYIRETELKNIENAKQKMQIMEQDMGKIFYIVFFLDKLGRTILQKEAEQDIEIYFTKQEETLIKEKATQYLINDGNDIVENQIEEIFKIRKR